MWTRACQHSSSTFKLCRVTCSRTSGLQQACSASTHVLKPCQHLCHWLLYTYFQVLNETFSQDLREYLSPHFSLDDASFISIDATGADVRVRLGNEFNVERLGFDGRVSTLQEAITAVEHVLHD